MTKPEGERKVYRIRRDWHAYLIVTAVLVIVGALLMTGVLFITSPLPYIEMSSAQRLCFIIPLIIGFGIAGYLLYALRYAHLTLSPEGLILDEVEYRLSTTWDNIERIEKKGKKEVLLLRHPVKLKGWNAWLYRLAGWHRRISIEPFGQSDDDGELAQDLRRYVPHIFSDTGMPQRQEET
jgi:hypothetical protein